MKSKPMAFKETTIYDWDSEPAEERPSEFAQSAMSGFAPLRTHRRPPRVNKAFRTVLLAGATALSLGGIGLYGMIHLLRA